MRFLLGLTILTLAINAQTKEGGILDDKAPLVVTAIDQLFDIALTRSPADQAILRNHVVTSFSNPNSYLTGMISPCTPQWNNKVKGLNKVMNNKNLPGKRKTEFLRRWIKSQLSACAKTKITEEDLLTLSLEMAKLRLETRIESETLLTPQQKLQYEDLKVKSETLKKEAEIFLNNMMNEYKASVPEKFQTKIDDLTKDLASDFSTRWETEWKDDLVDFWSNNLKKDILDMVNYEEAPKQAKKLLSWLGEQINDQLNKNEEP